MCELEMMTFSEKHRWVFHLAPTACSYSKLDGYFGKLRRSEIEVLQAQGDFGDHLEVRKVNKTKNQRLERKLEKSKAIAPGGKETIRNTFVRMVDSLSRSEGA